MTFTNHFTYVYVRIYINDTYIIAIIYQVHASLDVNT